MKVFLSWSGELSRQVAEMMRHRLKVIMQHVEPFMSSKDIASGQVWQAQIGSQLIDTSFGILFLTEENLLSPWLLFEAGAIAHHVEGRAAGLLLGNLQFTQLEEPLRLYQHRQFTKEGVYQLLEDMNNVPPSKRDGMPPSHLDTEVLRESFEIHWPVIEQQYNEIVQSVPIALRHAVKPRKPEDILEDMAQRMQSLEQAIGNAVSSLDEQRQIFTVLRSWERERQAVLPTELDFLISRPEHSVRRNIDFWRLFRHEAETFKREDKDDSADDASSLPS